MKQVVDGIDKDKNWATFEYDDQTSLATGGEATVFLSADKKHIIKIYHANLNREASNLLLILTSKDRVHGVVMPNASYHQWMEKVVWYTNYNLWITLPADRRGDYRGFVKMLHEMAIGVRYLNFTGFGHADLSYNNVLCNPVVGKAVVIDTDGLVVKDFMRGAIDGTANFMAPELVDGHVGGKAGVPSNITDRHALAVLIFMVLLWRHPLIGKRPPLVNDIAEDNFLQQSSQYALYVHHPTDHSNAVDGNHIPIDILPQAMQDLFAKAFIDGLRNPSARPHPDDWVRALRQMEADLVDCTDPDCELKQFPSLGGRARSCPFCGAPAPTRRLATLKIVHHTRDGVYATSHSHEVVQPIENLTRHMLFGQGVADSNKAVMQIRHDDRQKWHITLRDTDVQVMLVGEVHPYLRPNVLTPSTTVPWDKAYVAVISLPQAHRTCVVKLE